MAPLRVTDLQLAPLEKSFLRTRHLQGLDVAKREVSSENRDGGGGKCCHALSDPSPVVKCSYRFRGPKNIDLFGAGSVARFDPQGGGSTSSVSEALVCSGQQGDFGNGSERAINWSSCELSEKHPW